MSKFTYEIFLSHNSKDRIRVRRLAERLRNAGVRVWFDEWIIKPGDSIPLAIEHGLEQSRTLVLCISPAALGSGWVSLEHGTVLFREPTKRERRFIPLLLADCEMPDSLKRYKYIDYRDESSQSLEELLVACAENEDVKKTGRMVGERILIVENNVALEGRLLEMMLTRAGYDVVGIAETEKDAVEIAMRDHPGIVLMDIELGDAEGKKDRLAGLRAAHEIQATTGAQVIFLAGLLAAADLLSEAQRTQGYEFLSKPVKETQLLSAIRLAVARRKRTNSVFVCYSLADKHYVEEMMKHINALEGFGFQLWKDTQITTNRRWSEEIKGALAEAKAAICLVSSSFIASEFIRQVDLPALLKARAARGMRIYPVFVNFVHEAILKPVGMLDFQGINKPDDPIAAWPEPKRHKHCWGVLCKALLSQMTDACP